jgi:hypothetical protein
LEGVLFFCFCFFFIYVYFYFFYFFNVTLMKWNTTEWRRNPLIAVRPYSGMEIGEAEGTERCGTQNGGKVGGEIEE